jgi:AmmeMemoRadiSam system protein B
MRRSPAVAGQFYHEDPARLSHQVAQYINTRSRKDDAIGIVVPHAGLVYSGAVAGAVYSAINFPKTFLMLGPNHTGLGEQIAIVDTGEWEIPSGVVKVDRKLASRILLNATGVTRDSQAHIFEHSLEVQLPFITFLSKEVSIVPIAIRSASFTECMALAETIAHVVKSIDYPVTILASSDMSHYLSDKTARLKDKRAIDKMLDIDPGGLYDSVIHEKISMCGYLPVTIMLAASKLLGAKATQLVKYMTSGEVSGDYDNVVGYAGIILTRK